MPETDYLSSNHARQYASVIDNEGMWSSIRLFATALPPDQRIQVLRGARIDIPLSSLSPEDMHRVLQAYGMGSGLPDPDTLRFFVDRIKTNFTETILQLAMEIGRGEIRPVKGGSFMTTMTDRLQPLYEDWILPGDLRTMEADTRPLINLAAFRPDAIWNQTSLLDRTLAQVAATEQVSFMAVIPEYHFDSMPNPFGKTPTEYFTELWTMPQLMHKWRENILLVTDPKWFYGDEWQYPYRIIKQLRSRVQKRDGLLSLSDIAEPLATLSSAQIDYLTDEFPFSGVRKVKYPSSSERVLEPLPQAMLSLCAFYRRYPKVWSEQGLPADLKMQALLRESKIWPTWLEAGEEVTALRIVDSADMDYFDLHHSYTLQATTSRQKWRDVTSFDVVPIKPKAQP